MSMVVWAWRIMYAAMSMVVWAWPVKRGGRGLVAYSGAHGGQSPVLYTPVLSYACAPANQSTEPQLHLPASGCVIP